MEEVQSGEKEPVAKKSSPKRTPKPKKKVEKPVDDSSNDLGFDDDIEFDDEVNDSVSSSEKSSSEPAKETQAESGQNSSGQGDREKGSGGEDGEEKPRRRRRRRRRKDGSNTNSNSNSNTSSNSNSNSNRGGGGGRGRRSNSNSNSNNQRGGRRPAKFEKNAAPQEPIQTSGKIEGVLELHPKGYGFLRAAANDYGARESDPFVSSSFVEKHHLREGIKIIGEIGPGTRGQGPRLLEIESIDGGTAEEYEARQHFDNLTPINPHEQLKLERGSSPVTMRVMDLLCPIGKGQRALLVAPPRSGKTMLLQDIAESVSENHPEVHLIVLLIDERPEEVTEMRRMVKGEVIASSMDENIESHVRISQLIFERGKRLAESGQDCLILMDSVTRTARAFNKWMSGGRDSKTGTGGLDVRAMDIPRKMFGTARRFDEGGSLTVVATALIDTGSRMDEAIFQEFKGTGNMELVLSRDLADRRIWPAIDISKSGTRREEKILDPEIMEGVTMLRRSLVSMNSVEAMEQLSRTLAKFDTNKEFLQKIRAVL
ncbi:transcription termination factor Rho [bacterium]|nr:transcription termination factor Rho [bacterium]